MESIEPCHLDIQPLQVDERPSRVDDVEPRSSSGSSIHEISAESELSEEPAGGAAHTATENQGGPVALLNDANATQSVEAADDSAAATLAFLHQTACSITSLREGNEADLVRRAIMQAASSSSSMGGAPRARGVVRSRETTTLHIDAGSPAEHITLPPKKSRTCWVQKTTSDQTVKKFCGKRGCPGGRVRENCNNEDSSTWIDEDQMRKLKLEQKRQSKRNRSRKNTT